MKALARINVVVFVLAAIMSAMVDNWPCVAACIGAASGWVMVALNRQ